MANRRQPHESKAHQQRRKTRARIVVVGFFLFVGVVVLLESPLTRVQTFAVNGNTSIAAQKIIAEAKLHKGMNLWQVNASAISHLVKQAEPLVESVQVHTDYLQRQVTLDVQEKHVVALYEAQGKFYRLLDDGTVFGEVSSASGFPWPIITAPKAQPVTEGRIPSPSVSALCRQLSKTSAGFLATVSEIQVDPFSNVTLYLDNGFAGRCDIQDFSASAPTIQTAVAYFAGKGYAPGLVDVSGGPPYQYTPFSDHATSGTAGGGSAKPGAGGTSGGTSSSNGTSNP